MFTISVTGPDAKVARDILFRNNKGSIQEFLTKEDAEQEIKRICERYDLDKFWLFTVETAGQRPETASVSQN